MNKSLFGLVAVLLATETNAANYYVAANGDNADPGAIERPFAAIQKAVDVMQPGDTCYVRAGTYREAVQMKRSGREGAPITIAAYPGEVVVLDGTEAVMGEWSLHEGRIYKQRVDAAFEQLFVDREMMLEARWPNTSFDKLLTREGWAKVGSGSAYGRIQDPKLAKTGVDWTGAMAVLNIVHQFFTWSRPVKNHAAGSDTFEYEKDMGLQLEIMSKRKGIWLDDYYYLIGKLQGLDTPGEWFLDEASKTLYLWSPDGGSPASHRVEVKARDYAIQAEKCDHIVISGLHFFGATFLFNNSSHCIVEHCHLLFPTHARGVPEMEKPRRRRAVTAMRGAHNTIRNCSLAYSTTDGFKMAGQYNTIENCLVHDLNWSGTLHYHALSFGPTATLKEGNNVARRNTIFNFGNVGMSMGGFPRGLFEYNHVHHGGLLSKDVSLVYTQNPQIFGTEWRYNWVHDSLSPSNSLGLRGDDQTRGLYVHHNVVWNVRRNAIIVKGDHHRVYNNTCLANGENDVLWPGRSEPKKVWRKQFPLLKEQNVNSLLINNCGRRISPRRKGEELKGDVSNNFVGGDLKLMDPKNLDFRPRADSPLVDAGRAVEGVTAPFKGEAPDIGAYEYGGEHWLPGHHNGVWVTRSEPGMLRVALTMPVIEPVTIVVTSSRADGSSKSVTRRRFTPGDWMQPQGLEPATDIDVVRFSTETWGSANVALHQLDGTGSVRVCFAKPDLSSYRTLRPLFIYSQVEQHISTHEPAMTVRPSARAFKVAAPVSVDGRIDKDEWPGRGPSRCLLLRPIFTDDPNLPAVGSAYCLFNDGVLYVAMSIRTRQAADLVREGGEWGETDGVEVDLQPVVRGRRLPIFVLHGFPSGRLDSVSDAGASEAQAAALAKATQYAARIHSLGWDAELRVPFKAMGIDDAAKLSKMRFNVGAYIGSGDAGQWTAWARTGRANYDLLSAGDLNLRPAVKATADNIIVNGAFESPQLKPWSLTNNAGRAIAEHKANRVKEGPDWSWCMKLECTDAEVQEQRILKWTQSVAGKVRAGNYVIGYDVRAAALLPRKKGGMFCSYVHVRRHGKPGGNVGQREYSFAQRDVPWTRRDCPIEISADVEPSMLSLQLHNATGTVWIDNVSLWRCE